ncbi:hypothetical protein PHYBLDRAFT_164966 [Phycomyces blakesleeanus NRRL 1555(-)]|uniref:ATP-dependent DNA helicase n=1 Tax=Phycomyces blakesleeanus (strain ATCC 8743b / DSM 1359 / FGSC 10004 / NBRC 33097 / NRRL 1555) TaxID=763407 RepID=A0A163EDN7_PHYB8|nr:hypothetical protein PHYBLDRAFT_164966 [Phycomyces blakesleeanus NRRL 1555(-)]OAD78090.1 hypothetical protein PHYBLDRAFT_164966 [Phycomyces blakesleeanus NRRL 1555(-)]|eukprot:XP_018296130.1 hypothetical protein PHYBLDRAFT_164966 [Phycomyces blakesleeanus NRRL 1555(-)]
MTPAGPICASCKQLGHSRRSNFSCPLNLRHKTLLIPQKRTSDNLSAQEEYQAESSRAGASRPRVEAVQNPVILTVAEINALFRTAQYSAETAASRPRVEVVQSRVVLTIAEIIALSRAAEYPAETAAARPRVEAVQDFVVPIQPLSIDLSFTEQYTAESDRDLTAAFEALQVSDVERVLDLTTTTATATATVIPCCSSCNGIGHQRNNVLFSMCCDKGHALIPALSPTPSGIADLLVHSTPDGQTFFDKIRRYNSTMSFTSMGANIDQSVANNIDSWDLLHKIVSVIPMTQAQMDQPKFAQIYIFDPASQIKYRQRNAPDLDRVILEKIQAILMEVNPFVSLFRSMEQIARENSGTADLTICLKANGPQDQQCYNAPTAKEVAVLIRDNETGSSRDIILHTHANGLQRINEYNRFYDALQYVLLFPLGDYCWTIASYSATGEKVSAMDWYANRLMYHSNSMHFLHQFGWLFQQYIIDIYAKVEHNCLDFLTQNQKKLRSKLYCGIQDALHLTDNNLANLGQQLAVYRVVKEAVKASPTTPRLYFVDGSGGTGKTFLFNAMLRKVRQQGKIALAVATSGIAALLLDVRLAFAMPINKSQGQTLDKVGLYLPDHVFGHGQLYVALSRVQTPDSVKIMVDMDSISTETTSNVYINNVVYNEVLSRN